jgi:hypothetical protein
MSFRSGAAVTGATLAVVLGSRPRDVRRVFRHAAAQPLQGAPDDGRDLRAGSVPPARGGGPACLGARLVAFRPRHHLAAEAAEVDAG